MEKTRLKESIKVANLQKSEEERRLKQELQEKREKEIEDKKEENLKKKEEIKNNFLTKKDNKLKQLRQEAIMLREQKKVYISY